MYTSNLFVFGHELATDKELNNDIDRFGIEFGCKIGDKDYELYSPYHGGKIAGDTQSVILGCVITDDDNNPNYVKQVRDAKEEDYLPGYNAFLVKLKADLLSTKGIEQDYDEVVDRFISFLDNNKPDFYNVEISS